MPYIKEENRLNLDDCIEHMVECMKINVKNNLYPTNRCISNEELIDICGDINYCFSRILGAIMGDITYPKIAIMTGILENIKQEFYRRVASQYEDKKIVQNGDIKEYKNIIF